MTNTNEKKKELDYPSMTTPSAQILIFNGINKYSSFAKTSTDKVRKYESFNI